MTPVDVQMPMWPMMEKPPVGEKDMEGAELRGSLSAGEDRAGDTPSA